MTPTKTYQSPYGISLYQADAFEFLASLNDESCDLIITDHAYESLEKYRKIGTTTRLKVSKGSSNKWFPIVKNEKIPLLMEHLYRILKKNSHCYMFCDQETMFILKEVGESVGFKFWKPLIWDKVNIGMGYHYRNRCEFILFFEKGKRKLNNLSMSDILTHKRIYRGYPTEKPVSLMQDLIGQSSSKGDLIVDPFFGSGSVAEAALLERRNFTGSDIKKDAINYAINKIEAIQGKTLESKDLKEEDS
jgi:site-specific DNA-methyltransferase (adenine-specific)